MLTGKARDVPEVNFRCLVSGSLPLRQVLSLYLEHADSARLAGQQALGILLFLPLQPWDYRLAPPCLAL